MLIFSHENSKSQLLTEGKRQGKLRKERMIHVESESSVVETEDRFFTVDELADRYGVTVQTIYAWNHKGTGPRFFRAGRLPRYRLSDCLVWEDARYADGGGEAA